MRIGLQIPRFTWDGGNAIIGSKLADIAHTAEDAGFYSIWVMDHFFQIGVIGSPEEPMLEGYSTLAYLAGITRRVKLGTLVTGVIYRYPGILVKTATTLDVLSGGRAYFGIGAAWFEREARALGAPFPPVAERFKWLEDALQIAHQMWSDNNGAFEGQHFQLKETLCSPAPISKPHPPIMIGGGGERKTLRLVAQYANACNLFMRVENDVLAHKLNVLQAHCEAVGRNYAEIEKTTLGTIHIADGKMSAQEVIDRVGALAELGFQHAIFNMPNVHDITPLEVFGKDIIPAVAAL